MGQNVQDVLDKFALSRSIGNVLDKSALYICSFVVRISINYDKPFQYGV
jgi:hypothetical protein